MSTRAASLAGALAVTALAVAALGSAPADAHAIAHLHHAWSVQGAHEVYTLDVTTNGCKWVARRDMEICTETITAVKRADGVVVPLAKPARTLESKRAGWLDELLFVHPRAAYLKRDGRITRILLDGSGASEATDYHAIGLADVDGLGEAVAYGEIAGDGARTIAIFGEDGREAFRVEGVRPDDGRVAVLEDHVVLFANTFPGESRVYDANGTLLATHPGAVRRVFVREVDKALPGVRPFSVDWEYALVREGGLLWPLDARGQLVALPAGARGAEPVRSSTGPTAGERYYPNDLLLGWIVRYEDGSASLVEALGDDAKGERFAELHPMPAAAPDGPWLANMPLWLHPIVAARRAGERDVGLLQLRRDIRELVPLTPQRFASAEDAWAWLGKNTKAALGL